MVVSVSCNQHLSHACGIESAAPKILKVWEVESVGCSSLREFPVKETCCLVAGRDQEMKAVAGIRHAILMFKTL
jgi:hypothetical protein